MNPYSIETSIDPSNKPSFLLDWELTMKCNLDCSYCDEHGHDNKTKNPPLEECLSSIDFMYGYVDRYMKYKPNWTHSVVLNIYGGESLYHPDIETILQAVHDKYIPYKDRWHLTITCTTNAVVSDDRMKKILNYIDEFTVSYHAEATQSQKIIVRDNIIKIKSAGRRVKCVVMMLPDQFDDCQEMIEFCRQNEIKCLPKQIDHYPHQTEFNYTPQQTEWFEKVVWKNRTISIIPVTTPQGNVDLDQTGRSCCGGRNLCVDQDLKTKVYFVDNSFTDWYCSVNWFFLFVKQLTGDVYVNKDCQMRFDGTVGPIGNIKDSLSILDDLEKQLPDLPVIQCKKSKCYCGICAPKAKNLEVYKEIMIKHLA